MVFIVNKREQLGKLLVENGVVCTTDALNVGVSKSYFMQLAGDMKLERASRGIYVAGNSWADHFYLFQKRYSQAVFSHESALYLHQLTDREPQGMSVTVKAGYHAPSMSVQGTKVYTVKPDLYPVGIVEMLSPFGNKLRVYDAERTLCDIIRSRSHIEAQERQTAFREYVRSKGKNIPQLMRYAKQFRVEKPLRAYLEVLL